MSYNNWFGNESVYQDSSDPTGAGRHFDMRYMISIGHPSDNLTDYIGWTKDQPREGMQFYSDTTGAVGTLGKPGVSSNVRDKMDENDKVEILTAHLVRLFGIPNTDALRYAKTLVAGEGRARDDNDRYGYAWRVLSNLTPENMTVFLPGHKLKVKRALKIAGAVEDGSEDFWGGGKKSRRKNMSDGNSRKKSRRRKSKTRRRRRKSGTRRRRR